MRSAVTLHTVLTRHCVNQCTGCAVLYSPADFLSRADSAALLTPLSVWAARVFRAEKGGLAMAKYTFSQGKIWVENGVYRPVLRKSKDVDTAGVVLLLRPAIHAHSEDVTPDKEGRPLIRRRP